MRGVLLVLLAGCTSPGDPGAGGPDGRCESDDQCGGDVCARNGVCLPASEIRPIHVTWTLQGMPASQTTCASSPDLEIDFYTPTGGYGGYGGYIGFAPVPCEEGAFSIDKLPTSFTVVQLGQQRYNGEAAMLDAATGSAAIDLPF